MSIQKLSLLDLQFSGQFDQEKLRRLVEEVRRSQQTLNAVISELSKNVITRDSAGTVEELALGAWSITVIGSSLQIRFNDGGTIRTGSITLT